MQKAARLAMFARGLHAKDCRLVGPPAWSDRRPGRTAGLRACEPASLRACEPASLARVAMQHGGEGGPCAGRVGHGIVREQFFYFLLTRM